MNSAPDVRAILSKAQEHERTYDWLKAAECYSQAATSSETSSLTGDLWEEAGFCFACASRQAKSTEEFSQLRQSAAETYSRSARSLEAEETLEGQAKKAQRHATATFVSAWLANDPDEKRARLDESLGLWKESLEKYKTTSNKLSYGKVCNDVLACFFERFCVASDWKDLKSMTQEGVNWGHEAVDVLSKLGDEQELLTAYFMASLLNWYTANFTEQEEQARKELAQRSLTYSEKALELSRHSFSAQSIAMANWSAAFATLIFTEKIEDAVKYAEEMLRQGTAARDNYLKGVAYYVLAFVNDSKMMREADPELKRSGRKRIIEFSENAINCLQLVRQDFFIAETYLFYVESYSASGSDVDIGPEDRRRILKGAVEAGRKGLEYAQRSGSNDALGSTLHALSKALHFYSNLETDKAEKKKLLEEALLYRNQIDDLIEKTFPSNDWLTGVTKNYLGLIKLDLSKVETQKERKEALLGEAADDIENSVLHSKRWVLSRPVPSNIAAVASYEDSLGGILDERFIFSKDAKLLHRAIEAYEDAAKLSKKVNLPSRAAESYWKVAIDQDHLGQHSRAAEHFQNAFAEYKEAAQRIPHFAEFYLDYGSYMNAWNEIERAKSDHERENYADASKHYEKVAAILGPSKLWSHLSSNFLAWSLLEKAEDLSRKENHTGSIEAFNRAADLFKEARANLEQKAGKIERSDEKEKADELCKASLQRKDYCMARTNIEEAMVADRTGDLSESASKYESAAFILETILEKEPDEKDVRQIAYMCRAWQKMKTADIKLSPELYGEASELFLKAKENSTKEKTALFASGNSAICKALEYGTTFEATGERNDFVKAKQYLENAAKCYLKAGFDSTSSWTSATEMLLDASSYTTQAKAEPDSNLKMKTLALAEKCLERSADLFEKAQYVGRKDEVLRILTKLRNEREFALSLGELLVAPSEVSSTHTIPTPVMSVEEPIGLVKFEKAFVQANIVMHQRELVIGETLNFEIHLANLGKETAFLLGIESLIPEGFELIEKPDKSSLSDSGLSFRGRIFGPLETAEMRLAMKSKKKGKFTFAPTIKYMDETGERKSCELEQALITVKELGIRGWLKGQA
jgi:exonuclease VII small subunit